MRGEYKGISNYPFCGSGADAVVIRPSENVLTKPRPHFGAEFLIITFQWLRGFCGHARMGRSKRPTSPLASSSISLFKTHHLNIFTPQALLSLSSNISRHVSNLHGCGTSRCLILSKSRLTCNTQKPCASSICRMWKVTTSGISCRNCLQCYHLKRRS
jgi:hypothetical protein